MKKVFKVNPILSVAISAEMHKSGTQGVWVKSVSLPFPAPNYVYKLRGLEDSFPICMIISDVNLDTVKPAASVCQGFSVDGSRITFGSGLKSIW